MLEEQEDVYYYITVMNENYDHPAMPDGVEDGIIKGMYLFKRARPAARSAARPTAGLGTILREVIAAAELLVNDFGVAADVWSVTSFTELRREAIEVERWNTLHPTETPRKSYVETCLGEREGPVIAATDYMRLMADQIRALGTAPLPRPRHRRLRPLRLPQEAEALLRGGPALGNCRCPEGTGRRGNDPGLGGRGRNQEVRPGS